MKFSIVIPCYEISKRIDSLFEMMKPRLYKDYEVIFVDDCSSDNSYELMLQQNPAGAQFKIVQTEVNSGPGGARNLGLSCAKGEYILFCDSDDNFDVELLQKIDAFLETHSDVDTIIFPHFRGNKIQDEFSPFLEGDAIPAEKAATDSGQIWSKLFSNRIIKENCIEFPLIKKGEDRVFWTYYCAHARNIVKENIVFYRYVRNTESITHISSEVQLKTPFDYLCPIYREHFPNIEVQMFVNSHLLLCTKLMCNSSYPARQIKEWLGKQNQRYPEWIKHIDMRSQSMYRKCIYAAMYYNRPLFIKLIMFVRRVLY